MPSTNTPERASREELRDYRRIVAEAIAELRSAELRESYAALSLEELLDQHIDDLEGDDPTRPGRLHRLRRLRDEFRAQIEAIKAVPAEQFRSRPQDPEQS